MSTFSAKFSPSCRKELKEQETEEKPGKPFPSDVDTPARPLGGARAWRQGKDSRWKESLLTTYPTSVHSAPEPA